MEFFKRISNKTHKETKSILIGVFWNFLIAIFLISSVVHVFQILGWQWVVLCLTISIIYAIVKGQSILIDVLKK